MSELMTPAEVSAEFAKAREHVANMRERIMAIPHKVAAKLQPADAAIVAPIIENALTAIFTKFESDLAEAEKQLTTPTESEQ